MNTRPPFVLPLLLSCALALQAPVWAAGGRPARTGQEAAGEREQLQGDWDDAQRLLQRGDYAGALQALERILAVTPNDSKAQAYRALCTHRLEGPASFPQLSGEQFESLQQRLQDEERQQRRAAAQLKAMDRQVKKEQERWDRELTVMGREAKRQQRRQEQQAEAEAVERRRAEREARRQPMAQPAVEPAEPPSIQAAPEEAPGPRVRMEPEPRETRTVAGAPAEGSVELAPVRVPATGDEASRQLTSPSIAAARVVPPAGAVQINADQMSVSPEKKLAIAEGNVEVLFENALLTCDKLTLFTDTKDVYAEGRVRLEEGNQVFRGELVHYNFVNKKGRFLQGTVSTPPWHQHGRSVEHLAEGVYQVTPGYLTSCELEPPHFKFFGRQAIVFADDKIARASNVALFVEHVPFFYLPWLTVADRQSPFFIIPGKKKPWGPFALMGYRYELPVPGNHRGTVKVDWRQEFGWGGGIDHQFDSPELGKGLLKVYYNKLGQRDEPASALPKGADEDRYRILWRHRWKPMPDTTVITDIQEFSDANFRKDFLFDEEYTREDAPESFVSVVTNAADYSLTGLIKKRMNRFQTVDEAIPQLTLDVRPQRIGESWLFSESRADVANLQTKPANSGNDTDVIRVDWFQQLSYALNLFRPVLITPRAGIRQTYYTKDIQSGPDGTRTDGDRDVFSGQVSFGGDASLKLFKIFPVVTNALGLNINVLRHVLTPTVVYTYLREPTVPNRLLNFPAAPLPTNQLTFGIENKLQTKRVLTEGGKPQSVDLLRAILSVPYTFKGTGNRQGGRLGEFAFDIEAYPWPWMRLETDWTIPSHFPKGSRDSRIQRWNLDLVLVGGKGELRADEAHDIQAPLYQTFQPGPQEYAYLLPQGQWYLGLGHRYLQNDKTEDVLQFDWRLSEKWQIGTFHRYTWKEVVSGSKRLNNLREYQYTLRRDLHDWVAEFVYRVDREYGEELFFTLTLKAYPHMPIEMETSYNQPKLGSQSSPFSPIRTP